MVSSLYAGRARKGFGKPAAMAAVPVKPLKRPRQARARFTVQAIYDAFVRIWRRDGWEGVTTRAVALETGISVGAFYDYFPNKQALLSGYVRHGIDQLLQAIDQQAVQPPGLTAAQRIGHLVRLSCGGQGSELPYFDAGMLRLEAGIAEPKHHRRVYEELLAAWQRVLVACTDLPRPVEPQLTSSLLEAVWGARRYRLLLQMTEPADPAWQQQMQHLCCVALGIKDC